MKEEQEREAANKRNTLSHTPERKTDGDSPRQSRSPLKNDKKEKVSERIWWKYFVSFQTDLLVDYIVIEVQARCVN